MKSSILTNQHCPSSSNSRPAKRSHQIILLLVCLTETCTQSTAFTLHTTSIIPSLQSSPSTNRLDTSASLPQHLRLNTSRLFGMLPRDNDANNEDFNDDDDEEEYTPSLHDLENARQRFEDMMSIPNDNISHEDDKTTKKNLKKNKKDKTTTNKASTKQSSALISTLSEQILNDLSSQTSKNKTPPPPLTTILRERKIAELNLLSSLSDSDEAVHDLWSLWFSERGPAAATLLLRVEELLSSCTTSTPRSGSSGGGSGSPSSSPPPSSPGSPNQDMTDNTRLEEAEQLLWSLIQEHGVHWAEPINRLATLMYIQGKYKESKALCEIVLSVKPWHMGALSGIVLVCASMNDVSGARMWADRRLPPLGPEGTTGGRERRRIWVDRAVSDAEDSLALAEKVRSCSQKGDDVAMEEEEFKRFRDVLLQHLNDKDEKDIDSEDNTPDEDEFFQDDDDSWQ